MKSENDSIAGLRRSYGMAATATEHVTWNIIATRGTPQRREKPVWDRLSYTTDCSTSRNTRATCDSSCSVSKSAARPAQFRLEAIRRTKRPGGDVEGDRCTTTLPLRSACSLSKNIPIRWIRRTFGQTMNCICKPKSPDPVTHQLSVQISRSD